MLIDIYLEKLSFSTCKKTYLKCVYDELYVLQRRWMLSQFRQYVAMFRKSISLYNSIITTLSEYEQKQKRWH